MLQSRSFLTLSKSVVEPKVLEEPAPGSVLVQAGRVVPGLGEHGGCPEEQVVGPNRRCTAGLQNTATCKSERGVQPGSGERKFFQL